MWKIYGKKDIDYPDSRYEELSEKVEVMLRERLIRLMKDRKNVVIDFSFWSRKIVIFIGRSLKKQGNDI